MKHLKILSLGLVAAAALMAFVGASTASATVLSGASGNLPAGTVIDANVEGTAVLHAGITNVECTAGTVKGTTSNAGSATETVKGTTSEVTFSNCNCSPIKVSNGTLEIHAIEGSNGNGTLTGSSFTAEITCKTIFGNVTCVYATGNGNDLGTLTGSNNLGDKTATMDINAILTRSGGSSLCAAEAEWLANYLVSTPDTLNVTKE